MVRRDDSHDDDGVGGDVAAIAEEFGALIQATPVDRHAAVRALDAISRLVAWKSLDLLEDDPTKPPAGFVHLPGDMHLYFLLEDGWGMELYSRDSPPDMWDRALLASLLTVLEATNRAMAGADVNKRAYGAFAAHALHPIGRELIDGWLGTFNWWLQLAESRRDGV